MSEKELEKIFKAVANKRRLAILRYLKQKGRASVSDIARTIQLSFKATSRHLSILSFVDILEKEQIGLTVFYFIPKTSRPIASKLLSCLS